MGNYLEWTEAAGCKSTFLLWTESWNERNFGTRGAGRVQPTHVETQDDSSQTSKLLLYLYWKTKGTLLGQEILREESGTSGGGKDYGFTGEEDGVNARSPFTALLKAPQFVSSS